METPQTGRRIVSKSEYAVRVGRRSTIAVVAVALWLATIAGVWYVGDSLFDVVRKVLRQDAMLIAWLPIIIPFLFLIAVVTFYCGLLAKSATKKASCIDPGVPLTRANTADLPAPESLVRASAEPPQAQEAVLLRAAEGMETPQEQLVRGLWEGSERVRNI